MAQRRGQTTSQSDEHCLHGLCRLARGALVVGEGQILSGRYRLLSLVGEGGMALVYKAHDEDLDRVVAIKVLRPEFGASDVFRREARAFAKLPHPNVVTVYDVGQDGETQYIVMEYVEGKDLKALIQVESPMPVGRAIDILCQICKAVSFAHDRGIIHCDLKPQNVLVLPDGRIKVTDFGIACAASPSLTDSQPKWGTPYYSSPELLSGKTLTPSSDVYSVGIMFYEMLAGKLPFDGDDAAEVVRQQLLNAPPPIQHECPRAPRFVQQVLDRALDKDPAKRIQFVGQLDELLTGYQQRSAAITQPIQAITPPVVDEKEPIGAQERAQDLAVPSAPQERRGVDWMMLILGALAFVAVMGLFPLWGTVLNRALGQRVSLATPTPESGFSGTPTATQDTVVNATATSTTEPLVVVPGLVGAELGQAQRLTQERGLVLIVIEERFDDQVPAGLVIEQTVAADAQLSPGAEVGVVISRGPKMVIVPEVIGFPVAVKQLDLEDLGLVTHITQTWSVEPVDLIVDQLPPAGTEVRAGSVVTLTVSVGPQGEVKANFGDKVLLVSCEFNAITFRPGDAVQMIITWQALASVPESYTVFIHITDLSGKIVTQLDRPPLGGSRTTDTWQPGEKLLDPYSLTLPRGLAPGAYWVRVGLYRGSRRLEVVDAGEAQTELNAVLVRQIQVAGN
jgi:hypothetical protein